MNVYPLEIRYPFQRTETAIYPALIKQNAELILVDCGYAGFLPLIEEAMQVQGLSLSELTSIIITHHDIDHVGGLFEIKQAYPHVKVYASETEAPYISGTKKSLRLQQAEAIHNTLPEDQQQGALAFQERLKGILPVPVDETFPNDAPLPFLEGVEVIATPGHMPGHISLYVKTRKTLIAADAVVVQDGELEIANPRFTMDMQQAIDSIKKLAQLEIETLICYHGGVVAHDVNAKLKKLIAKYNHTIAQ